jgi:ATP-dependent Lhr-like helicase
VASHHGSLSRAIRLSAEERLKAGQLKAIVATASLELGIDVGFIDLVCQIGSPRSIATLLQRVGRSGHALGLVPKGRLFALTRDELLEGLALVRAVRQRRLDAVEMPRGPLDILAQQIVAAVACQEWTEDALYELCRGAWPYHELARPDLDAILQMLSEGAATGRRRGAYLYRDLINRRLRARPGARIVAATSGGAIPETADYRVVTESDHTYVGTVNEDFAVETMAGDVFLLGNTSWRVRYVRGGEVVVNDAEGSPATIPFWLGEAPARTVELSAEVSRLRDELARLVETDRGSRIEDRGSPENARDPQSSILDPQAGAAWLEQECGAGEWAARQAALYVAAQQAALGLVPTQQQIVFERFFDESGGMQLVIHAPLGARINRAWGLALRKRFCRSFDFELQASADDNGIVLSLGPQHSFPIEQMFQMLSPHNAEHLLKQALLAVPMFQTRWRWNATRALQVLRQRGNKKVPPPLQRFRADDLLTAVFPAQTACQENQVGDIEIPDHPLVRQTVYDCLHEAMDLDGWLKLLDDIEQSRVDLIARDTREPSPFAHEILNAHPYAFLDDAPLEERRARAVATRRTLSIESVRDLGQLDPEAIARVRAEAWPLVRDADELHDALLQMGALPSHDGADWAAWFHELASAGRATELLRDDGPTLWVATERLPLIHAVFPDAVPHPPVSPPPNASCGPEQAFAVPAGVRNGAGTAKTCSGLHDGQGSGVRGRLELVRGRLEFSGAVTATQIAHDFALPVSSVQAALEALEGEGFVLRGQFTATADSGEPEWCERRLLARIHRLTLDGLRRQIQPVEPADFIWFLLEHQHVLPRTQLGGRAELAQVIGQLQGVELPAGAWEHEILPARLPDYEPAWLDELSFSGQVAWGRLQPPEKDEDSLPAGSPMTRVVPIALVRREDLGWLLPAERPNVESCARSNARLVLEALAKHGALFPHDLRALTDLLPAQLDDALSELAALGLVTADGFAAIRSLVSPDRRRLSDAKRRRSRWGRAAARSHTSGGRWSLFPGSAIAQAAENRVQRWAWQLLQRYGVMFRDLLNREAAAPPWRALVPVYRRLEARGEIRGGRFIAAVAGEQFALPSAVDRLRAARDGRDQAADDWLVISAADPSNLFGILRPGPRIPATARNKFLVRGGQLVASLEAGEIRFHEQVEPSVRDPMTRALKFSASERARRARETGTLAFSGR